MRLVYLVGAPCIGKSTLVGLLTRGCERQHVDSPIRHDRLVHPLTGTPVGIELGGRRDQFPGTDSLPMNVSPRAAQWLEGGAAGPLVIGEGDRLAHVGFLESARRGGYRVTLVHLTAPGVITDARCQSRGSTQNEAWRRGRATKAARLAARASTSGYDLVVLDGRLTPGRLAAELRGAVPALHELPVAVGVEGTAP
jgi:hypothetical protein